jgi:hypothetical protein
MGSDSSQTVEATERDPGALKADGYEFVTIPEMVDERDCVPLTRGFQLSSRPVGRGDDQKGAGARAAGAGALATVFVLAAVASLAGSATAAERGSCKPSVGDPSRHRSRTCRPHGHAAAAE